MDTRLTGSEDRGTRRLLAVTDGVVQVFLDGADPLGISYMGRRAPVDRPVFRCRGLQGQEVAVRFYNPDTGLLGREHIYGEGHEIPLLFEQKTYTLILESLGGGSIQLAPHRAVRSSVASSIDGGRHCVAALHFGSEVGETDLTVLLDGRPYLKITLEVFPVKIDYRTDYEQIVQEVNSQVRNLAFEVLTRTLRGVRPDGSPRPPTDYEWIVVLNHLAEDLIDAVEHVLRMPHHTIAGAETMVPADRVRRPGRSARRLLRTRPGIRQAVLGSRRVPGSTPAKGREWAERPEYAGTRSYLTGRALTAERLPDQKKFVTFDTPENRFVKHVLGTVVKRLRRLLREIRRWPDGEMRSYYDLHLGRLQQRFDRLLQRKFFEGIGALPSMFRPSLTLQMGVGYREILRSYLTLLRGLAIEGRVFRLGLKELHELYEIWCFFRLREILTRRFPMVSQDVIKVSGNGIVVRLGKGKDQTVLFRAPDGSEIELGYNRIPPHSGDAPSSDYPTIRPQPDLLLTLKRTAFGGGTGSGDEEAPIVRSVILDAKYRLQTDPGYIRNRGGPGPVEDDIRAMHTYRDTYLYWNQHMRAYERQVALACVLFPWKGSYEDHYFRRSLEHIGVGGLPFLPGETQLLEEFLDHILDIGDSELFERTLLPRGHSQYWMRRYRHDPVLVGTLRGREFRRRLAFIEERGYYHVPAGSLAPGRAGVSFLALFYDGAVRDYFPVHHIDLVRERDLPEITLLRPLRSADGTGLYYKFAVDVERRRPLDPPVHNVNRRRVSLVHTTMEALLSARIFDELYMGSEMGRRLLEGLRLRGVSYDLRRTAPSRWVVVLPDDGIRITSRTDDQIEVSLPGQPSGRRFPGSMVRARPWAVVDLILG